MEKRTNPSKREIANFPVWTFEQAQQVVPYLLSIVRSVRETYLDLQYSRKQKQQLENYPGRPKTSQLLAIKHAANEVRLKEEELAEATQELGNLNIFSSDPLNGIAMIPFLKGKKLAWYVFDLFADEGHLVGWRFHRDDLGLRRPLSEATSSAPPIAL